MDLSTPIEELRSVKPNWRGPLKRLGLRTAQDLLLYQPYDLESYAQGGPVSNMQPGQNATVTGRVYRSELRISPRKGRRFVEVKVQGDEGGVLTAIFFNQNWQREKLRPGMHVAFSGQLRTGYSGREMVNPTVEPVRDGREPRVFGSLMPKYHLTETMRSFRIREAVLPLLPLADALPETLPAEVRLRHGHPSIAEAVRWLHEPESTEQWTRAQARFAFAELFELQVAFVREANRRRAEPATPVPYRQEVIDAFKENLAFQLTNAQRRGTWDVFKDLAREQPMSRLLNGDVGSGKTAVAAAAVAMVHAAGAQSVVMAPTEILARQHLGKFRAYLEPAFPDLKVDLLVGGLPAAERRRVRMSVASGHTALLVGTHALIESEVEIADLGLAVVDEQHRFGTRQREQLRGKGRGRPHFLAMTATPIPRTLALALYGEMDVSVLDELPPGRTPVLTEVVEEDRERAYELVRSEVRAGRQAYVICPLIEESENLQAKAATVEYERLQKEVFPDLELGLVHGRLKDKDEIMRRFAEGAIQVLVATPVVEVGVDVANATVMLIEGAERFGLAQLHQLRGRVGRGAHRSYCLLLADSAVSTRRLNLVESTTDGFALAQEDMRMRGMGELLGARQHGMTDAAMQALLQPEVLNEAREDAEAVVAADPELARHPALKARIDRLLEFSAPA